MTTPTNSSPSTPATTKQSGKSVATATTASMSGGGTLSGGSGGGGNGLLHSPALTDDLTLVDPSRISQGKVTRAPPVLNMDNLPKIGMSSLGAHRGGGAVRPKETNIRRHYRDFPESKKDELMMDDTSLSEDDDDADTHSEQGIRLSRRTSTPHDPCMPMVMEDVRELLTTSVTKTLSFFNQVSHFFHDDGSRRNQHTGGINRPTTVFIVPRSRKMNQDVHPVEDTRECRDAPPLLTDDGADDLSSLTEPPVFLPEKTGHVLTKPPSPTRRRTKGDIQATMDKNGEESIEFESESIQPVELFDDVLLGMKPVETLLPPSIFPILEPPTFKQTIPSSDPSKENNDPANAALRTSPSEALPVLADKISEVSTDVSSIDPRFRFPFANFRPRSRKDHRYLAAVRDEYRSLSPPHLTTTATTRPLPPPPPPPPPGAPRRQVAPKMSPTSVKVIWSSEAPKPGLARSLRQLQRLRRLEKSDLASVEC